MSLENEHHYWLLTEKEGWIQGDKDTALKNPPEGLVLALDFHLFQSCSFAPEDRTVSTVWSHEDKNRPENAVRLHGKRPKGFEHWPADGRG